MSSADGKLDRATSRLPVIGHHRRKEARKAAQDKWFEQNHDGGYFDSEPTVWEWLKGQAPTKLGVLEYVSDTFPCSKWLLSYNLQWLLGDLVAGITVGAIIIPQGMAYAKLAQLPVEYGLYTSVFGGLFYWVFGTSKDINIGPVAVASIVTGSIVAEITEQYPEESHVVIASTIAMFAGAVVAAIGILRLGWLVDLISLPAVSSFISGTAITITVAQIPPLLGIGGINTREPAFKILINIFKKIKEAKIDAAPGISALVVLYLIKWGCQWMANKKPRQAKTILFLSTMRTVLIIMVFVLISFLVNRTRREDPLFRILGFIPKGFNTMPFTQPSGDVMKVLMGQLPAAVVVLVIEHISIGKSFGRVNGYLINPNSELIAIGVTNLLGTFIGAYAATGSFSRTAVNSKAGSRTPLAGVFTAALVIIALYTLTPMFYYVPTSALAAVIIHAIGDLVTPPSTLYEFWTISPLDVLVFAIGFGITIFNSIENGVFAMIGLSLAIQLWRIFQARGRFLGRVSVRTLDSSNNSEFDEFGKPIPDHTRSIFLPLDRHDGSNPKIELEKPYPGIFIYRFMEGFNYPNANSHLDFLASSIISQTRPTTALNLSKKGDLPWSQATPRSKKTSDVPDTRPTLKAVILDFSPVNNVDLTSVQALIDCRNTLDRHAAPHPVQWHFASIQSRWARRALASAGFGLPSFESADGSPVRFRPVYSLAEMVQGPPVGGDGNVHGEMVVEEDVERGQEKIVMKRVEVGGDGELSGRERKRMATLHGINRPYFHADIQAALISAVAMLEWERGVRDGQSGGSSVLGTGERSGTESVSPAELDRAKTKDT